jgi:hypothetical protein
MIVYPFVLSLSSSSSPGMLQRRETPRRWSLVSSSSSNVTRNPTSNWRRILMTSLSRILAATAMVAIGGQLFAQSDTGLTLDKKVLTLSAARKVVAAAEAEATKRGLGVVIVVVDDSGTVIELSRMDAAQVASVNVGIGKARTGLPSFADRVE